MPRKEYRSQQMDSFVSFLLLSLLLSAICLKSAWSLNTKTYVIHMDYSQKPTMFSTHEQWHFATLSSVVSTLSSSSSLLPAVVSHVHYKLLYTYGHAIHGFSARLTEAELEELEKHPAHIASYPDTYVELLTTYTPEFLGLSDNSGIWPASSYGSGAIIGVIDTGVWPESKSFDDQGMPPVPARWKGGCENSTGFSPSLCNRKLIGARSFSKALKAGGKPIKDDYDSPRDSVGHGTHTSSTAAGNFVLNTDYFGYAKGTAKGIAPAAHVAMYKVLFADDDDLSAASDVLAGMDQAIADGVDIMSLSIALGWLAYHSDAIAIAALSATRRGIFVTCAGGNRGLMYKVLNVAPWIMTVGASTTDRTFDASVTLGNGFQIQGTSYYPGKTHIANLPLYYGRGNITKASCHSHSLHPTEVSGKVVLCTERDGNIVHQMKEVKRAGGAAGIFQGNPMPLYSTDFAVIPSVVIPESKIKPVIDYASSKTSHAGVAEMKFRITKVGTRPAPQVAYFSSRGPNPITPSILKPDIIAPGKDVLAAWTPNATDTDSGSDHGLLLSAYRLASGTSMATPHVAAMAALVRGVHPDWSPAAIRSAIMTTAETHDNTGSIIRDEKTGRPATPLDYGAGHANPNRAMDPGLIYDLNFQDYVKFVCSLNYTRNQVAAVLRVRHSRCEFREVDLNYPSFAAVFHNKSESSFPKTRTFSRVVTNVGEPMAVYYSMVEAPKGMKVTVVPSSLLFDSRGAKRSFTLHIEVGDEALVTEQENTTVAYGFLRWIDEKSIHIVSSPIVTIVV